MSRGLGDVYKRQDAETAEAMAARDGSDVVLAGERGGEALAGFDLGNSPAEFTAERVGGRTVVLTTTNGTGTSRRQPASHAATDAVVARSTSTASATRPARGAPGNSAGVSDT